VELGMDHPKDLGLAGLGKPPDDQVFCRSPPESGIRPPRPFNFHQRRLGLALHSATIR